MPEPLYRLHSPGLPRKRFLFWIDGLLLAVLWLFSVFAVLIAAGLLWLSIRMFVHAFRIGLGIEPPSASALEVAGEAAVKAQKVAELASTEAVTSTLHGLELVLLSPLAYFLIRSLIQFVRVKFDLFPPVGGYTTWHSGDASASLTEVKALIVSLLGGVVAVHLVGEIITGPLVSKMWLEIAVLVVLIGYYFGLDHRASSQRAEGHHLASGFEPPPERRQ